MRILVTGFEPFGGETINPSWEAVKLLPDKIEDAEIIKLEIPPVRYRALDVIENAIVTYNPRYASSLVKKLLESAIANAENNNGMKKDNLYVAKCYANKGPTMKRIQPRAQGRAYRIEKRTSHITVVLDAR